MTRLLAGLAILFASVTAHAQDALKVEVVPKALAGQGLPMLVVIAEVPLESLVLSVKRSTDRKKFKWTAGPLGAGRRHEFPLEMKRTGKAAFTGTLGVQIGDGQGGEMPIDVQVELLAPLKVEIARGDVDVEKHVLKMSADRDVNRIQVSVMSDLGTPLGTIEKSWGHQVQPAGSKFDVKWKQSRGTVMRITVQAWDVDGFFGAVELFPWQVNIPHEEVHFATGSYEITEAESKKLASSLELINRAIDKYGALAKIRLFIGGHTDTVGDSASNRVLSSNRARAIGRWFRSQGVTIPIQFAGFGEDVLLVNTPDSTDNAKNRRAEYIVAVDPPSIVGAARWAPL